MISPERFYRHLSGCGIDFFTGVPDSLLRNLLYYFINHANQSNHCITGNEAHAIALATGYHLKTGKLPLVYMQNSGLGNAINPLTSLTDPQMFSIPMILMIGWRGAAGRQDEPQHKKMGSVTEGILQVLQIPVFTLSPDEQPAMEIITRAVADAKTKQQPVAVLVAGDIFEEVSQPKIADSYMLSRERVLQQLLTQLTGDEVVVCTTGKTGREFDMLNRKSGNRHIKQFLSTGSMGLANHVALGISLNHSGRVIMLDGDGALLMHLGTLALTGNRAPSSFIHILFNNGCHESVGGHPTLGFSINFGDIARACGYKSVFCITNDEMLNEWLTHGLPIQEKQFVEIRIRPGSRADLSRPSGLPRDWKSELMKQLNE